MPHAMNGEVRIHYEVEGSGPPLMLHTGFIGVVEDWYTLGYVDALKPDYRLIMPDPRGQGRSDKPHAPEAYGSNNRVADVIAVLDALGIDRVDFWGYSMGGRVGFDLAVQHPERLRSLVVGGSSPFAFNPDRTARREQLSHMAEFLAGDFFRELPTEIRDRWLRVSDPEALIAASVEQPSLEPHLARVEVRTLIYIGDRDASAEEARRAAEAMPRATFLSMPGLDHMGAIISTSAIMPHARAFFAASPPTGSSPSDPG